MQIGVTRARGRGWKVVGLLSRKVCRDLWDGRASFGACLVMLMTATCLWVAFLGSHHDIDYSCEETYNRLHFLDFSIAMEDAPPAAVDRISQMAGVARAEGRQVLPMDLVLESSKERFRGRMISLPHGRHPLVNDVFIDRGDYPRESHDILLERRFAEAHGLNPGAWVKLDYHSQGRRFRIAGLVTSPEYLWLVENRYDLKPASQTFAVAFVDEAEVATFYGERRLNEIHVCLATPFSRDRGNQPQRAEEISQEARHRLATYDPAPPILREQQASNALLIRDRRAFLGVAILFPSIFLSLGAFTLFLALWQLITRQRQQLGVLMTQGFSPKTLLRQYLGLSAVLACAGACLGCLAGGPCARAGTAYYAQALGLTHLRHEIPWLPMLAAFFVSLLVALLAGWLAARRILRLSPCDALRSEFSQFRPPPWMGLAARFPLPYRLRLPLRNLMRNPGRTLVAVLGIAYGISQLLMTLALFDSQRQTLDLFFGRVVHYDLEAMLRSPVSPRELPPLEDWPGVLAVESHLVFGARVDSGRRESVLQLLGLPVENRLHRLLGADLQGIPLNYGVVLGSSVTLHRLAALPGEKVRLRVDLYPRRTRWHSLEVGPPLYEPVAGPVRLPLRQVQKLLSECTGYPPDAINSVCLKVLPESREEVYNRLFHLSQVGGVVRRQQVMEEIQEVLRVFDRYKNIMLICTCLLSVAVLVGVTALNITDRRRELATMSILGVPDKALAQLLAVELTMLWLLALPVGCLSGYALGSWLVGSYRGEFLQLQMQLRLPSVAWTAAISLLCCLFTGSRVLKSQWRSPEREALAELAT